MSQTQEILKRGSAAPPPFKKSEKPELLQSTRKANARKEEQGYQIRES